MAGLNAQRCSFGQQLDDVRNFKTILLECMPLIWFRDLISVVKTFGHVGVEIILEGVEGLLP